MSKNKNNMTPEAIKTRSKWLRQIEKDKNEGKPLTTWMDKKGKLYQIKDMSDDHLIRTIYFLENTIKDVLNFDRMDISNRTTSINWRLSFLRKEKMKRAILNSTENINF